jgi:glycosyltransferase involved in cell wall biosynthesis
MFDVTALCFYRRMVRCSPEEVQASLHGMRTIAETEAFPVPQEWSRVRLGWDHLRSVATHRAYTVFAYESRPFRDRLKTLLRERRFDLVHMDSLDLSGYLPLLSGLPVVCAHHNVESQLLHRRAVSARSPLMKRYLLLQAALMEAEERQWCQRVNLNITVSEPDREALCRIAPQARYTVMPNGVDTEMFHPANEANEGIVFVGAHDWYPNREAMDYFCNQILPKVRTRLPDIPVVWVGRTPETVRREYWQRHRVRCTGYVDDVRPFVQRAACYVAPLRTGGGTRLKILDAWAMGKAVVSTSVGCEGLAARDAGNLLVRDTAEEFASAVCELVENPSMRHHLEMRARETAVKEYDWEVIAASMLDQYGALLQSSAS